MAENLQRGRVLGCVGYNGGLDHSDAELILNVLLTKLNKKGIFSAAVSVYIQTTNGRLGNTLNTSRLRGLI